jgi:chaperonin GroEL (HSP60 family)
MVMNINFIKLKNSFINEKDGYLNYLNEKWKIIENINPKVLITSGSFPIQIKSKSIIIENVSIDDIKFFSKQLNVEVIESFEVFEDSIENRMDKIKKKVKIIKEYNFNSHSFIYISCDDYLSIILRGPSETIIEEAKRSLSDSIRILNNKNELLILPGIFHFIYSFYKVS